MFIVIICIILALVGVGFIITGFASGEPAAGGVAGGAALFLAVLLWILGSMTIVEAKNVGVLTTFGKPDSRTLDPGLHWKKPWQKVTDIDGTIQTDEYKGDKGCIYVRIGDGSRSCLTATIRWRVNPDTADVIYGDYRSDDPTDNLRSAVVSTQFKSAAQAVLGEYNPIAGLQVVEGSNAAAASDLNFAPDYDKIAADLTKQMADRVGDKDLVIVESVTVSYLSLADSTQQKLNDFIAAVGDTRIASQRRSTAAEEAKANKALSDSISNEPNVLVSKCLDTLADAVQKKYSLPAGFSCWGGGGAVVIPGTK